jgi:hypothetical protein
MNRTGTWTWRFGVLGILAVLTAVGTLVATGKLNWRSLRGSAADTDGSADVAVQAMLTDAESTRISELVKQMVNPESALEATAQLRDHIEGLVNQKSPSAPPSMAWYLECLAPRFASLDTETRRINITLMSEVFGWFGQNPTTCWTALLSPSKSILTSAMSDRSADVTLAAIQFVRACWEWSPPDVEEPAKRRALGTWKADLHNQCVECADFQSGDKGPGSVKRTREDRVRAAAGVAVVSVPIDTAASRGLVLLRDASPTVRRAVLLALSERPELLSSEDVVGFLRDGSPSVRAGADIVLASRGLTPEQIALAKRATDPSPLVRAQAPRHILESTAIDRVVWLTHLSRDIIASVRIEAARALATVGDGDCTARLTEMADVDPDKDVRKLARDLLQSGTASTHSNAATETLPTIRSPKAD